MRMFSFIPGILGVVVMYSLSGSGYKDDPLIRSPSRIGLARNEYGIKYLFTTGSLPYVYPHNSASSWHILSHPHLHVASRLGGNLQDVR